MQGECSHTHAIMYLSQPKMQRGIDKYGEVVVQGMAELKVVGMVKSAKTMDAIIGDLQEVSEREPWNIAEVFFAMVELN